MWHLKHQQEIYLFKNEERHKAEGNFKDGLRPEFQWVCDVRPYECKGKEYLVFKCYGKLQPKPLKLENFNFRASALSSLFKHARSCEQFINIWKKYVAPNLNSNDGKYSQPSQNDDDDSSVNLTSSKKQHTDEPPSKKQRLADATEEPPSKKQQLDIKSSIDANIAEKFIGMFNIPINCLIPPRQARLLRVPNMDYVKALKEEMINNPTTNVAPIIGVVRLREEEEFDKKHPESYVYETIGGNHSRIALNQLLDSGSAMSDKFKFRAVSVYNSTITDEEAQHLALRHNRATEFTNKMLTQDKIHLSRIRLYALHDVPLDSPTPERSTEWRKSCEETLMVPKKKLEENLVFFLAGLSKHNYKQLVEIFHLYEDGKLCKLPKTKQGLLSGKADCSSSNFKGLRGLSEQVVTKLLDQVIAKKLDLKKLNGECKKIKDLRNIKTEFVKQTGLKSWDEAMNKFPSYTGERLEQFVGKAFDSKNAPMPEFLAFCRKALATSNNPNIDDTTVIKIGSVKCVCYEFNDPTDLSFSLLSKTIPGFPGFKLIFATFGSSYSIDQLIRFTRGMKTSSFGPEYAISIKVKCVSEQLDAMKTLQDEGWICQCAYGNRSKFDTGLLFKAIIQPLVIATSGPLPASHVADDIFDDYVLKLLELYTCEEDYILVMDDVSDTVGVVKDILIKKRNLVVVSKAVTAIKNKLNTED